jgi:hypothetical protein
MPSELSSTGRIEATSECTRILLGGAGRGQLLGRNALTRECAPGDGQ